MMSFAVFCLIYAAFFLLYRQRNTYQCETCLSRKHEFQWFAGSWSVYSFPITAKRVIEQPSLVFRDFVEPNHQHQWVFAQGSPYYCFGVKWGGCAIGGGRHQSEMATLYQIDEDFRSYISKRIQTDISKEKVYGLLLSSRYSNERDEEKATNAGLAKQVIDDYYSKR